MPLTQWCRIWINLDLAVSKLAWGIGWTFIKALKNLKICFVIDPFCSKRNVSARKFQRNYVSWHWKMMENLSENWLAVWKITTNLVNLHVRSWMSENLLLMGSFCEQHKDSAKKVEKSYVSWHWRKIQTLKKKSLFVWKMTWEIWWILIRAVTNLKTCSLMGYFCQKYVMFELKYYRRAVSWKITYGFKNDIRNLVNFHTSSWK